MRKISDSAKVWPITRLCTHFGESERNLPAKSCLPCLPMSADGGTFFYRRLKAVLFWSRCRALSPRSRFKKASSFHQAFPSLHFSRANAGEEKTTNRGNQRALWEGLVPGVSPGIRIGREGGCALRIEESLQIRGAV